MNDVERWVRCETMALAAGDLVGRMSAAAYVERAAHDVLWGKPIRAGRITLDTTTPRFGDADPQAKRLAEAAEAAVAAGGWDVLAAPYEMDGQRADLLLDAGGRRAVAALCTYRRVGGLWLQVGAWASAYRAQQASDGNDVADGLDCVVVHVPRVHPSRVERFEVTCRPAADIEPLSDAFYRRRRRVLEGNEAPLRQPGTHCGRCPAECSVRMDFPPRDPPHGSPPCRL